MTTMQDIADRVGVHRVTVSNVLNERLSMQRPDAAKRAAEIRRVAREMGYRPSSAARTVRKGSSGLIGMLRSADFSLSVHNPAFESGLDEALHERGLCLVRDIIDNPSDQPVGLPRVVREQIVDGLLINYAFGLPDLVKESLDRCSEPAVWINRKRTHNCVRPADADAAADATRYFLKHGHRRVMVMDFAGHGQDESLMPHYSWDDRYDGYAQVMTEAGLAPRRHIFRNDEAYPQRIGWCLRGFKELMQQPDRPTAILASDGGRHLLLGAEQLGLRVPEDLSIMTFDHDGGADHWVGVDRLVIPHISMGRAAVEELCALIETPAPREPVLLPFEFHAVGTVGRPPPSHC